MYWNVKKVSEYLQIKTSTVYAWVNQGKIPHVKIHGLIRFRIDEIKGWVLSFQTEETGKSLLGPKKRGKKKKTYSYGNLDSLIEQTRKNAYTTRHKATNGETRQTSGPRKEKNNGSV